MKQTPNYNFPILEAGDKYSKEYQNDAFRILDTELKSVATKVYLLDDIGNAVNEINNTKNIVDEFVVTANETKAFLDNATTNCINTLNSATITKQEELTATANVSIGNVNTAIGVADSKISEMNQWIINNGDIASLSKKVNQIKNHIFRDGKVKFIGHRGFSAHAPENTIPSFRLCGSNNYWGAECDIRETSDGKFVLMHDDTVDRTTNGTGTVSSKTLAQIKALTIDAGNNISANPTLRVPTLEEYLQICRKHSLVPIIELKAMTSIASFLDILKTYQVIESCMLISFNKTILEKVRELNYKIEIAYLSDTMTTAEIEYCKSHNFNINVSHTSCTEELVKYAHINDILVGVWTVDDVTKVHNFVDIGVDFITTNSYVKRENEMYRPYVEIGGLRHGKHVYASGTPYEITHLSNLEDKTRVWTDKLNKLEGWETVIYPIDKKGYTVSILFYDKYKNGISDLGWLADGVKVNIPTNAVYYEIYIGGGVNIEYISWATLKEIKVALF